MTLVYIILFLFGLIIGSFLNVVIFRYQPDKNLFDLKNLSGRSRCPKCRRDLRWYELIPLFSFVRQKAKCLRCQERISWQYPLVELGTGLVTVMVPYVLGKIFFIKQVFLTGAPIAWLIFISVVWIFIFYIFILISVIDIRFKIIPNETNLILLILGFTVVGWQYLYNQFGLASGTFLGGYASMFGFRNNLWFNHLGAMILAGGLFYLVVVLSRGKGMGMGDVKLAGVLGLIFGWPDMIMIIILAFIVGAGVGIVKIVREKGATKKTIPFGPFLTLASLLVFSMGGVILRSYFSWFGLV